MADNPAQKVLENAIAGTLVTEVCRTRGNEQWIEGLGTPFIEVRFYVKGAFVTERHVHDPDTLRETISMAFGRLGARAAVYPLDDGRWVAVRIAVAGADARIYPTREAAEMVAIHRA